MLYAKQQESQSGALGKGTFIKNDDLAGGTFT